MSDRNELRPSLAVEWTAVERGRPLTDAEIDEWVADQQTPARHGTADVATEIAYELHERLAGVAGSLAGLAPAPQVEPLRAALERLHPQGEAIYVLWSDIEAALQASPQPESRAVELLREAALSVVQAQEAVRDAINGQGHPGEDHDNVLGGIYSLGDGVRAVDEVGGCAKCGGQQYGAEDDLNRAYGRLRAALGLEVRPWEYQAEAAYFLQDQQPSPASGEGAE